MKKKKAVIFDVDGLMLNTEFVWLECWMKVAADHGIPEYGPLFHKAVGTTGKDIEDMLDRELPHVPEEERRQLMIDVRKYGNKVTDDELKKMPGLVELLDYLEKKGYRVAVATTTSRDLTEHRLKKENIYDRFEYILCGDEVVKRKPDPEIYLNVLTAMALKPEDVLVLEDTGYGVSAAYAAGCDVIMVPSVNEPTKNEEDKAYAIVNDLFAVQSIIEETMVCVK
ncbi:MAG: HAD family phosphatase [Oscillospiraceae bacterium]|nr:HAD family phosphatase [Oscillospiraceae bacterium]